MSTEPVTDPTPEADPAHPNEEWWKLHGGADWLQEIQERLPQYPRYRQQEAFLLGLFLGLPPSRVLDFGCGYGRHLKNLRSLPQLDLFGCDISDKMLETASTYLADPELTPDKLRLVKSRSRLPYPDQSFDVVLTSEVLIHVDTLDVVATARELWRVASSLIVHIENPPAAFSHRESSSQGGCWLHNFHDIYDQIGHNELLTFPTVIDNQCVYVVVKPESRLASTASRWAEPIISKRILSESLVRQQQIETLREQLKLEQKKLEITANELGALEASRPIRLSRRAKQLAVPPKAISVLRRLADRVAPPTQFGPRRPKELSEDLPYANIATRASISGPAQFIEGRPEVVALCHPDWRGIRAATYGQSKHVLEIPGIISAEHCQRLVRFLEDSRAQSVVINGFPPQIDKLVFALSQQLPDLRTYFVYHGTPALDEDPVVQRILELTDAGAIEKIGFVKKGMAEFIRMLGYPAEYVMNVCRLPSRPPRSDFGSDFKLQVGVFAPLLSHKNVPTQLIAALMIPGTVVHMCEVPSIAYLKGWRERIVSHGILPREEFLDLLGQMHATLYVSLVECYPMTVLESLAAGAVCVTSHTSSLFDDQPDLLAALVVRQHDNPLAIAKQLTLAIEKRHLLVPRAQAWIAEINALAERRWADFLRR